MRIKEIYKTVAKKHGISAEEAEAEINKAIAKAFENPTDFAKNIPCEGNIPTTEEIIKFCHMTQTQSYGN